MKANCWEVNLCGREPGGDNARELGVCPAATERSLDGVHGGRNAGRACWAVAGTFCGEEVRGTFAKHFHSCRDCNFHRLVREEEGGAFVMAIMLLGRVKKAQR